MKQHQILEKYIIGLNKGLANSLMVVSKAGYGKTSTTLNTLNKLGLKEEQHYRYINNYITPVELYNMLDETNSLENPKILVLDDIEDTLRNMKAIGMLKGALWSAGGVRKVSWYSGTKKIKHKTFNFRGRIIFLLNHFNARNPVLYALKDRGLYYEMKISNDEMLKLMEEKVKEPYLDIPLHKRKEIMAHLQKVACGSKEMTLRLLPKAYNLYLLSPNHHKQLISEMI